MRLKPIGIALIWRVTRTGWSWTVRIYFSK